MLLNLVQVTGNLTADPEVKYFDSGAIKASFRIAVNEPRKNKDGKWGSEAHFFDVECWSYVAEKVMEKTKKGIEVYVSGKLQQQRWEDKTGQNRNKTIIAAREVQLTQKQSQGVTNVQETQGQRHHHS